MTSGDDIPRMLGDRYEVGELLGRGGMAEVHLCRDHRLGRLVAVKMLRGEMAADPVFQARFRREAHSAAALNHPSVVAVHDTGEDRFTASDGKEARLPYIVMEHVEGKTVKDLLGEAAADHARGEETWDGRRGPGTSRSSAGSASTATAEIGVGLGTERAVEITAGVLTALDYSHRQGIVHRDIKPANVMVTPDEVVKVMDFGIARVLDDASATMTQTSAVIGTAQYLSPEQARGESVDARTDLYSAGCLLYEVLTGQPPFTGDSPVSVAYQHVRESPAPPSTLDPSVTPEMDQVVMHALAKDREDRYASAAEFRRDLQAAGGGRAVAAPTVAQSQAETRAMPQAEATRAMGAAGLAGAGLAGAGLAGAMADDGYGSGTGAVTGGPLDGFGTRTAASPAYAEQPPRKRKGPVVFVVVASVLAAALLGVVLFTLLRQDPPPPAPTTVAVPDVSNLVDTDARRQIEAAGLMFVEDRVADDAVPENTVISTDPAGGEQVPPNSDVTVTVSTGPDSVEVPDVSNQTESGARSTLNSAGFTVAGKVEREASADVAEGDVIRTQPEQGTPLAPGETVTIVLSTGRITLEDVEGRTGVEATQILSGQGLQVTSETQPSGEAEAGVVLDQSPAAGTEVDPGSTVTLTLAAPPPPEPSPEPTDQPTDGAGPSSPSSSPSTSPSAGAPSGSTTRRPPGSRPTQPPGGARPTQPPGG